MSKKLCFKCGRQLEKDEDFCEYCGEYYGSSLKERKPIEKKRSTYKKGKTLPKRDRYASSGFRLLAWLIDIGLMLFLTWLLVVFLFWRTDILFYFLFHTIAYFIGFIYFFLFETFAKGQTLGKMICGIKTVNEEKLREPSMKDHLLNCLLKCHWLTCLIDFIIGIIYNYGEPEKRLRIMQNVSQTVVIKKR